MMTKKTVFICLVGLFLSIAANAQTSLADTSTFLFRKTELSFEKRVDDLVGRLTLQEKIQLMQNDAKPIERLGIPAYNWWNECLHGVARDGIATVFPQAIGLAASWDTSLIYKIASTISTEARAKHQEHIRKGERKIYQGLTMWTPNINIFRDPRWGRGQETYGEDPFLTAKIGVAFVKGLQGNDSKYFKVIATAKHYAVHSGSEFNRHIFDAKVSKEDMFNTYLPAFESLVKEGNVYSVMGAYNRVNGVPACANSFLLDTILRKKWGFTGYVVSDCGAISDIFRAHKYASSQSEASALAVKAGCDLVCGSEYNQLEKAVASGFITTKEIDVAVKRLQLALFKLGMYDNDSLVAYQRIPFTENNSADNMALAKIAALKSMVLLQNKNKRLPLSKSVKSLAIIGPYANDNGVLNGNYNGTPSSPVNFINGIKAKLGSSTTIVNSNFIYKPEKLYLNQKNATDSVQLTVESVKNADIIIFCGGISARVEGEESKLDIKGFYKGDRTDINLPDVQLEALKALKATGKPVILVLTNGSALALNWENENLDAIIEAWYPGEQGGNALADILFGDYNPSGKLPITFYKSLNDLPEFEDYAMKGRTYKYFTGSPLYPFGYGLSYSTFDYSNIKLSSLSITPGGQMTLTIDIKNKSTTDGTETIQLYAKGKSSSFVPQKVLVGFEKITLKAGETKKVQLKFLATALRQFSASDNDYVVNVGDYILNVGSSSSDIKLTAPFKIVK
jgi:beta-glucosidase